MGYPPAPVQMQNMFEKVDGPKQMTAATSLVVGYIALEMARDGN